MGRDDRAHGRHHSTKAKGKGHQGRRTMRTRTDLDQLRWSPPAWFTAKYPHQVKGASAR